jgi:hypothetical protein
VKQTVIYIYPSAVEQAGNNFQSTAVEQTEADSHSSAVEQTGTDIQPLVVK